MVAVIISLATALVACPFLARLRWQRVAVRRACHFHLVASGRDRPPGAPAMHAAISSLRYRRVRPPLVIVHRYRREGTVRAALTIVGRHPDRVAELIAAAAGGRCEPAGTLELPAASDLRYARRGRGSGVDSAAAPESLGAWIDSVLAGAGADAILSVGVTPAARWEDVGNDAPLRSRVLAGAGDPVTAGTLAAGCGAHLPGRLPALVARRPGDGPIVAAAAVLAVGAGMTVAVSAATAGRFGAAAAGLQAGVLAAAAVAGVVNLRLVRITELCWRQGLRRGVVLPERPLRLARRAEPTTRRTVGLGAAHLAALCAPPAIPAPVPGIAGPPALSPLVPPSRDPLRPDPLPPDSVPPGPPANRRPPPAWLTNLEKSR